MKKITEVNVGLSVKSLDYDPEGNLIIGTSESVIFSIKNFQKNNPQTNLELLFEVSFFFFFFFFYLDVNIFKNDANKIYSFMYPFIYLFLICLC